MHGMIIQDRVHVSEAIEDGLRDLGYRSFDLVATGDDAIAAAEVRCPDLITANDKLADGCGVEAVLEICLRWRIPVVFTGGEGHDQIPGFPDPVVLHDPLDRTALKEAVGAAVLSIRR